MLGYNFRLSDIHAALGRQQLKRLEQIMNKRTENANFYTAHINHSRVSTPRTTDQSVQAWHLYSLFLYNLPREKIKQHLQENGIETGVYYPTPAYQQPFLHDLKQVELSRTEFAAQSVLQIPVHPKLKQSELEHIVKIVNSL